MQTYILYCPWVQQTCGDGNHANADPNIASLQCWWKSTLFSFIGRYVHKKIVYNMQMC